VSVHRPNDASTPTDNESLQAMPMPRLTTPRLVLRAFIPADAPTVERLAGAREVADTTLTLPHPYPAGGGVLWIESHAPAWAAGERLTLAICIADAPHDIIGAITLSFVPEHGRAELGYWIGSGMWGRGYATEAARAMVEFGFGSLRLNRIQAHHFTRNPASGRVLQKVGMRLEGVSRQAYRRWDRFEDVAMLAILASEFTDP
jgi:RimJ/RimL family protein N-acetyltransferase